MLNKEVSFLRIETDNETGKSEVELDGTPPQLLFNLTALPVQICEALDIHTEAYAASLPELIREYKANMFKGKVAVGFNPFRRG